MVRSQALQFVAVAILVSGISVVSCDGYWEKFDKDHTGSVGSEELKTGFKNENIELNDEQVAEIMHVADYNNDGTISQNEFDLKIVPYFQFKKFDKDNNGYITKDELPKGFQEENITVKQERIDEIFELADVNHDGKISYREFVTRVNPFYKFVKIDKDGNGEITKQELKDGFTAFGMTVSDETLDHLFKVADINHDNKMTYTEFVNYVQPFFYFEKADKNHNGAVTVAEMKEAFKDQGINLTDEKAEELAKIADTNCDNLLNYLEFLNNIFPYFKFIRFDKSGDGEITKEELKEGMKPHKIDLSDYQLEELYQLGNKGNTIPYAAFLHRIEPYWYFRMIDKTNNGSIGKPELSDGFKLYGVILTTEQDDNLFKIGDVTQDGDINYEEFLYEVFSYFTFRRFDKDKSDSISKEELGEGLKFYGIDLPEPELNKLFMIANGNTGSPLNYAKFLSKVRPFFRFRKLDSNKSGSIDATELADGAKFIGKKMTKTEAYRMIEEAAKSGQSTLTYNEYLIIDSRLS